MFEVGEKYKNRKGCFKVNSIDNKGMEIEYIGGEKVRIEKKNIPIQERIVKNVELEEFNKTPVARANFQVSNNDVYKAIGYLAANGSIFVELIEDYKNDFFEKYNKITNDDINEDSPYIIWRDKNKLWTTPSIRVNKNNANGDIVFSLDVPIYDNGIHYCIYKMDFLWYLMEMGFRIGSDHDIDEIFDSVLDKYKDVFLKGFDL
ncbi:MAG: hypothetical protein ACOCP4_07155 [Candidatus Woesearchaeota archaeon]